jgi:acyl-CoA thioester hydrolase
MTARQTPSPRSAFARFVPVTTRWVDNDAFGHLNNVVYYSFFDTAVNRLLIEAGALDVKASPVVGLVVETRCVYFASLAYPDPIEVGVAMEKIGASSATYRLGVFREDAPQASAQGWFTHVYVDRATQRPVPIPTAARAVMNSLTI